MDSIKSLPYDKREIIINQIKIQSKPKSKLLSQPSNHTDYNFINNLGIFEVLFSINTLNEQEKSIKLFKIDDMFSPHNIQNIVHNTPFNNFNLSQRVEGEVSYLLEMQPDATYQVKYKQSERKKSFSHLFEDIVCSEFYELQYPESPKIQIIFKQNQSFDDFKSLETFYEYFLRILVSYDKFTYAKIKKNSCDNEIEENLNLNWIFTLDKNSSVVFCKDLFPLYVIMKIRAMFIDFTKEIQNRIKAANVTPFRVNILSFCDIFLSHIIKVSKDASEETKLKYFSLENENIFNIINELLNNSVLKNVIYKILQKIMVEQTNVLKIIRGLYIQFREKPIEILHEKENIDDIYLRKLDKLFRFSKPNYFIHKYMLIIEIPVVKMHESLEEEALKQCKFEENSHILNEYIFMISNKYEFYECIFNNEQIIHSILGKYELEEKTLSISKNISALTSKNMTVSINFDNLLNILKQQYYSIKSNSQDRYSKILKYEKVISKILIN